MVVGLSRVPRHKQNSFNNFCISVSTVTLDLLSLLASRTAGYRRTCGEVIIVQGDGTRKTHMCKRDLKRELQRNLDVNVKWGINPDATNSSLDVDDEALATIYIDRDMSCSKSFIRQ